MTGSKDYYTNKHQVNDTSLQIEDKKISLVVICRDQKRTITSKEERIVNVSSKKCIPAKITRPFVETLARSGSVLFRYLGVR
jgi:hypothetical protein